MRVIARVASIVLVLGIAAGAAHADVATVLTGRVADKASRGPVEGATVIVSGDGFEQTATTDREGRYALAMRPGTYEVRFAYGTAAGSRAQISVERGRTAVQNGFVEEAIGEVIEIEERLEPPVKPKARNWKAHKTPPYSERAVMSDAWTRAWMLLDLDETGQVTRFKFLKEPGYDLEAIAAKEVWRLRFDPARDDRGRPMRAWVVWSIEWPSAWWLVTMNGTSSGMPKLVGFPPYRQDHYVPCAGTGPMHLESIAPRYKDCSEPDLSKAAAAPWILR